MVSKLTDLAALDPMNVMILGAECRNLLRTALGHIFPLRRTKDVDIAIALSDWNTYDNLVRRLSPTGQTGVRYLVDGIPVDLFPFGSVEDPAGTVAPAQRRSNLSVVAFRRSSIAPWSFQDLRDAWLKTDLDYLASRFGSETIPGWPTDRVRRTLIVNRLSSAIAD